MSHYRVKTRCPNKHCRRHIDLTVKAKEVENNFKLACPYCREDRFISYWINRGEIYYV